LPATTRVKAKAGIGTCYRRIWLNGRAHRDNEPALPARPVACGSILIVHRSSAGDGRVVDRRVWPARRLCLRYLHQHRASDTDRDNRTAAEQKLPRHAPTTARESVLLGSRFEGKLRKPSFSVFNRGRTHPLAALDGTELARAFSPIIVFAQQVLARTTVTKRRHHRRAAAAILVAHRTEFGHSRNLQTDELATLEHAPARMRLEVTGLAAPRCGGESARLSSRQTPQTRSEPWTWTSCPMWAWGRCASE
jgi:hypothetical protein